MRGEPREYGYVEEADRWLFFACGGKALGLGFRDLKWSVAVSVSIVTKARPLRPDSRARYACGLSDRCRGTKGKVEVPAQCLQARGDGNGEMMAGKGSP